VNASLSTHRDQCLVLDHMMHCRVTASCGRRNGVLVGAVAFLWRLARLLDPLAARDGQRLKGGGGGGGAGAGRPPPVEVAFRDFPSMLVHVIRVPTPDCFFAFGRAGRASSNAALRSRLQSQFTPSRPTATTGRRISPRWWSSCRPSVNVLGGYLLIATLLGAVLIFSPGVAAIRAPGHRRPAERSLPMAGGGGGGGGGRGCQLYCGKKKKNISLLWRPRTCRYTAFDGRASRMLSGAREPTID